MPQIITAWKENGLGWHYHTSLNKHCPIIFYLACITLLVLFFSGLENKSHFISKINRARSFLLHYGSHINWNWTYLCFLHIVFLVFVNVCPSFLLVRCDPPLNCPLNIFHYPVLQWRITCESRYFLPDFPPWPSWVLLIIIKNMYTYFSLSKKSSLRKCSCFFLDTTQC